MTMLTEPLAPIEDFSMEGRSVYAATHHEAIREALYETFWGEDTVLPPLGQFGFKDGVPSLVEFVFERFQSDDFDVNAVAPRDRNLLLFTRAAFWLQQKVSARAYLRILSTWRARMGNERLSVMSTRPDTEEEVDSRRELERFARTLRALSERTCAELVELWLESTVRFREWLGSPPATSLEAETAEVTPLGAPSGKQVSVNKADALFRYLVLHLDLLGNERPELRAVNAQLFNGTPRETPFRVSNAQVAEELGLRSEKTVGTHRNEGVRALLEQSLAAAERNDPTYEVVIARFSLRRSLLDRYRFKNPPVDRMKALPRVSL